MDTDSSYLALAEDNLDNCILTEKKTQWTLICRNDCRDNFIAEAKKIFFPYTCCAVHKKHDKREPGLIKENFRCTGMFCLCSKTCCRYDSKRDEFIFSSKELDKMMVKDTDDGPMSKYRQVLYEAVNLKSTNRGFKTSNH